MGRIDIKRRGLASTGFAVSRISLGCVTFGREINEADSFAILDCAREAGINLLDTAEAYGGGQVHRRTGSAGDSPELRSVGQEMHSSELTLGRWLTSRRCRDEFIVQTKVTPPLSRQRILDSIDASLQRLQIDVIDIFLLHAFDAQTPLAESLEALDSALQAGKIRQVGCSNFSDEQLAAALDVAEGAGLPRLAVTQLNYNLAVRDADRAMFPLCRRRGVGVQTYSPLGAGFLTGKYQAGEKRLPAGSRFEILPGHADVYFHEDKFLVVERLQRLSSETGISMARLAMAWVLKNSNIDAVLVGARTTSHLQSAIAASEVAFEAAWEVDLLEGLEGYP
jgi:1-deoxyxylulose-5-phosphate synthase